jgi:hypothetical protein
VDRRAARVVTVVVAVVATLGIVPGVASAAPAAITPGVLMLTPLDRETASACTANFVFTGGGATSLGYSAHCAGSGGSMGLSGCEEPALPLGTDVFIEVRGGERTRARLAYSSWHTMQQRHETDESLCLFNDFALVELDPGDLDRVDPTVPRLGGPTGLDTDGTRSGEAVFSYQPNNVNRALKEGRSLGDAGGGLTHHVSTRPAGNPGDSGSGYLDADGEAFGVLSTQFLVDGSNDVTDLAKALSYANRFGGLGQVALVPGNEPFTGG